MAIEKLWSVNVSEGLNQRLEDFLEKSRFKSKSACIRTVMEEWLTKQEATEQGISPPLKFSDEEILKKSVKRKQKRPFFALRHHTGIKIPLTKRHLRKITGEEAILLFLKNINSKAEKEEIADYLGISGRQTNRYCSKMVPALPQLLREEGIHKEPQ